MSQRPKLPSSVDGMLSPFMSKNRLRTQCDDVDAMLGGAERLYHEASRSPEAYWEFKKLQAKMQPKEVMEEHSLSSGMEALLKRVEERKKARIEQVVDVPFVEVTNAPAAQLIQESSAVQHHGGDQGGEAD
jgi:hypothetical protein